MHVLFRSLLRYLSYLNILALFINSHFVNWIQRIRFNLSQLWYLLFLRTLCAHGLFLVVANPVVVLDHCSLNVIARNIVPDSFFLVFINEFGSFDIGYFHGISDESVGGLRSEMLKVAFAAKGRR